MRLKLRFLQAATALLYMGPLLAGLAGFDWWMIPPLVSIFVLWLALLRPHQWPRTNAEWLSRRTLIAVAGQVLSQVVLVAACFGIGRGIGGVLGYLPIFHPILPVAVSFLAIPMMRLFWDSERALKEGLVIDELLYPHSEPPSHARPRPDTAAAIAALMALDDAADPAMATARLEDALDTSDGWLRLAALSDALAGAPCDRHQALRRAVLDWATDPEAFAEGRTPGALRLAFVAAGSNDTLLRHLLPRATLLLTAAPFRADQFPDPAVVEDMARRDVAPDVGQLLLRLADLQRGAEVQGFVQPAGGTSAPGRAGARTAAQRLRAPRRPGTGAVQQA